MAKVSQEFNVMKRLGERQVFIFVLVSLLLYALVWYGFTLHTFDADLPKELPLPDGEDQSLPVPLWQAIQSNILFPQINIGKNSYRVSIRAASLAYSVLCLCHLGTGFKHPKDSFYFVDTPNIIFRFTNYQAYQCLDLPPPGDSAYI